ncbi:MAG: hypothetical protein ACO3SL_05800 [Vulcanococcus sp.]
MVYATCTVHPEENGELLEAFLKDHPQLRLEQSFQLWPGQLDGGGDGFFAARIVRT